MFAAMPIRRVSPPWLPLLRYCRRRHACYSHYAKISAENSHIEYAYAMPPMLSLIDYAAMLPLRRACCSADYEKSAYAATRAAMLPIR